MASNITLVITSCDRHDLLRKTLDSFLETTDMTPQATIIIEDSRAPMPSWMMESPYRNLNVNWIANDGRLGQIYSIDRAYAEVKTDYVAHWEDDWLAVRPNYMRAALNILNDHPQICQVSLRGNDCNGHPLIDDPRFPFKIQQPYWHGVWGGWSFNPSLFRTATYWELGCFGKYVAYGSHGLGHEAQLSKMMLDRGFRIGVLP